jgi:hypothetical protein
MEDMQERTEEAERVDVRVHTENNGEVSENDLEGEGLAGQDGEETTGMTGADGAHGEADEDENEDEDEEEDEDEGEDEEEDSDNTEEEDDEDDDEAEDGEAEAELHERESSTTLNDNDNLFESRLEPESSSGPSRIPYRYPASVEDWMTLPDREQAFKVARFLKCTEAGCNCQGLVPPAGANIVVVPREEVDIIELVPVTIKGRTGRGWWEICGRCGHSWGDSGHIWPKDLSLVERNRRGTVVGRIEELLQVYSIPNRRTIIS